MKFKTLFITFVIAVIVAGLIAGVVYLSRLKRTQTVLNHLSLAEKALEENDLANATQHLQIIIERYDSSPVAPKAHYLLAKINFDSSNFDLAKQYSDALIKKSPQSEFVHWASYFLGAVALESDNDLEKAEQIFEQLIEEKKDDSVIPWAETGLAKVMIKKGKLKKAKKILDNLYGKIENLPEKLKKQIKDLLGEVNIKLLFSPEIAEGDQVYTIKKNDTLYELARKFKVTQELLMRCNNITDPRMLKIGRQIKIPRDDFSIVVDKTRNVLTLYSGGKFFKEYPVRTGKYDYLTPVGEFRIEYKKKNPEWVDPRTHKRYPPNHPENELGTRWMAFKGSALGIHGTIHPETIGDYASYGCVGMLMPDVEELYDIVPVGTPVKIIGNIQLNNNEKSSSD